MKTTIKILSCVLALSAVTAFAGDMKGEKIMVTELPAAVNESVTEKWPDATIKSAEKSMKDDEVCYKITVTKGDETHKAWVGEDGTIRKTKMKE